MPKPNVCADLVLNKVVLRPERAHRRTPTSLGLRAESFEACSEHNGQPIHGWHLPPDGSARAVALLNPPNRGTRAEALDHAALLVECGCHVVLYDYQGFGDSPGLADVRTLVGDARGVLAWARQHGILADEGKLVLVGLSLGSLVAIHLAARGEPVPAALVLDGAVEPFRALRRSFGPLGAVVAEVACTQVPPELDSLRQLGSVPCATLFVHGSEDSIGTAEEVALLVAATPHASLWLQEGCGHLDIIGPHRVAYGQRLKLLLDACGVR